MRHCRKIGIAIAVLCPAVWAQTVLTEDFEQPVTADYITYQAGDTIQTATNTWSVEVTGVDLFNGSARGEADAYDGLQAVDLAGSPGPGVISTPFNVSPGASYVLTFHYSRNNNIGNQIAHARVEVLDGNTAILSGVVQHDPSLHLFSEFLEFRGGFVATAPKLTLRFTSLDPGIAGIVIDAISIDRGAGCVADFNGDGSVNTQDVLAFLNAWVVKDARADINGDGAVNTQDVLAFLNLWTAGC